MAYPKGYFEDCAECGEAADYAQIDGVWLCKECAACHGLAV